MRSRTAQWFECKIKYEKMMEDGLQKQVVEQYVVDALSFAEAEQRITEEMFQYISGEFEVADVKKAAYKEIFFMSDAAKKFHNEVEDLTRALHKGDMEKADEVFHRPLAEQNNADTRWYKAKLQFITIDEKTEKEKRTNVTYLVQACSLHNALDNIDTVMKGTMIDYVQANVGETQLVDVFETMEQREQNGARSSYAESRQSSTEGQYTAEDKAAELMAKMAEEVKDASLKVEDIVDRYVKSGTPELRQQLIDKLTEIRKEKFGIE